MCNPCTHSIAFPLTFLGTKHPHTQNTRQITKKNINTLIRVETSIDDLMRAYIMKRKHQT